jgi:hypothetical protein
MIGLRHTERTRTNVGLAEYSGEDTRVNIYFSKTLLEIKPLNNGEPLERSVTANSHKQLLKVFERLDGLGSGTQEGVEAKVFVEDGGTVYSYATIVDNVSGDPVAFVSAND